MMMMQVMMMMMEMIMTEPLEISAHAQLQQAAGEENNRWGTADRAAGDANVEPSIRQSSYHLPKMGE